MSMSLSQIRMVSRGVHKTYNSGLMAFLEILRTEKVAHYIDHDNYGV